MGQKFINFPENFQTKVISFENFFVEDFVVAVEVRMSKVKRPKQYFISYYSDNVPLGHDMASSQYDVTAI